LPNPPEAGHLGLQELKLGDSRRPSGVEIDPKWHLNGHHELSCACGQGKTFRRVEKKRSGEAVARLEGSCEKCGSVSLTAGQWRLVGNASQKTQGVAKARRGEEHKIDWRVGNPLTFNDPVSSKYGSARFRQNEGFHGALVTRFGLLKEKAWYRDRRQAERDIFLVFSAMHALAKEQRRRAAKMVVPTAPLTGVGSSGPPPAPPPRPLARAA
jgi:hypothetical protein